MGRRKQLRLGLADSPIETAYSNLLRAVDSGRVTPDTALVIGRLLERRAVVADAATALRRLEQVERMLEQNAQDSARPLPAYRLKRLPAAAEPADHEETQ